MKNSDELSRQARQRLISNLLYQGFTPDRLGVFYTLKRDQRHPYQMEVYVSPNGRWCQISGGISGISQILVERISARHLLSQDDFLGYYLFFTNTIQRKTREVIQL